MRIEALWAEDPEPYGGLGVALEVGEAIEFAHGLFGKAVGYRLPPSFVPTKRREVQKRHGGIRAPCVGALVIDAGESVKRKALAMVSMYCAGRDPPAR